MPSREPSSPWAPLRRHPRLAAAAVLLLAALVLVTVLGGWARTTPEGVTRAAPGAEIPVRPFRVQLDRAAATYVLAGRPAERGLAYLVVEGELTLDTAEMVDSTTLNEAFSADLPQGYDAYGYPSDVAEAGVTVARDGSTLLGLGPGLTYDVLVSFVVDEADVPEQLTVTLNEHVRRESSLDYTLGWFDPAPVARVTFDVAPLPAHRPKDEY